MSSPDRHQLIAGLAANRGQFALLLAVNAFVGSMAGLERSIVPLLAREEFGIESKAAAVSFVAAFGLAKALANLFAGNLSDRFSRRSVLVGGWLIGLPVPFILMFAPSWNWVIGANVLLGVNQGLAWSMTVNMKLDLAGERQRGLALGLNESAGYLSVAAAAYATGFLAEAYGLRPEPFYLGAGLVACGLALSVLAVRDTSPLARAVAGGERVPLPSLRRSLAEASWQRRELFGASQAGFVNNLNDALAWGIFPLFFLAQGLDVQRIGALAAAYPLTWAVLQAATGWLSDLTGRKPLVVAGMLTQGVAIAVVAGVDNFAAWLAAVALLGVGTAMVYPTLQASVSDSVLPRMRATALGAYRFWRDLGAIAGALAAGILADLFSFEAAIVFVALLTAASGLVAGLTMRERAHAGVRRPEQRLAG